MATQDEKKKKADSEEDKKNPFTKSNTTIKKTENTTDKPVVADIEYTPEDKPFEYKENTSVFDILRQGRDKQLSLEEKENRARKAAKFAAFTDFFTALGGLAGGGDAPTKEFKQSPYLTQAFNEISKIRDDKENYERYYQQLYNTTRQNDYNKQLENHQANQKELNSKRFESAKEKARAINSLNKTAYESNNVSTSKTYENDPLREKQISIQQQNANANSARANAYVNGKSVNGDKQSPKEFVSYIDKETGSKKSLDFNRSVQLLREVVDSYEKIEQQGGAKTPFEREVIKDIGILKQVMSSDNMPKNKVLIQQIVQKYMAADKENRFSHLYDVQNNSSVTQQPQPQPKQVQQPQPKQVQQPQPKQVQQPVSKPQQTSKTSNTRTETPNLLKAPSKRGSLLPK